MTRQIKFRAWDKKDKNMAYDVGLFPHGYWMEWQAIPGGEPHPGYFKVNPASENFIIMQFTGLLDKNGVEIYEGDILQYESNKRGKQPAVIVWSMSNLGWSMEHPTGTQMEMGRTPEEREVIGNIYENPELLK